MNGRGEREERIECGGERVVGEWGIKHGGMRNNSAGIRVTRTRGRKQSKRSRGYSDLSAVTSGNGSVDKLRGTTISRPLSQGAKREVTTTFLSRSYRIIRFEVAAQWTARIITTHDYVMITWITWNCHRFTCYTDYIKRSNRRFLGHD